MTLLLAICTCIFLVLCVLGFLFYLVDRRLQAARLRRALSVQDLYRKCGRVL